ncbi:hypothetical protein AC578_4639 [Pseudocercospora eumusae]|uniref:Uncharacterized protein n=1 Tax=Pseudocercospora eumusae TaxID=321146 RepID=A0A139H7F9_9PEZI|nr:hypothetical protein AC578_4639 [Pseudocercospora eumusae]
MAIRAPWKGWQRTAMPVVSALILIDTFVILVLSTFTAAALQLDYDNAPEFAQTHSSLIRAQLVFFWCMIPLVSLIFTASEMFALWTDRLRPSWILLSSITAVVTWTLEFVLWELCIQAPKGTAPRYCPWVYRGDGRGQYATWYTLGNTASPRALPTLLIFYLVQLAIASAVVHRQRKSYFRKSDLVQRWPPEPNDEVEEVVSDGLSEPTLVPQSSRSTTPAKSLLSLSTTTTTASKLSTASFPWISEADEALLGVHVPAFFHQAKLIPSRLIGSLDGLGHRTH